MVVVGVFDKFYGVRLDVNIFLFLRTVDCVVLC